MMMNAVYLFAFMVALTSAAIQPSGPVYRSVTTVNSTPVKTQQPLAEERESNPTFQTAESVAKPTGVATPTTSTTAAVQSPNPSQSYLVHYYSNAHPGQNVYTNPSASGSVYTQPGVNAIYPGTTNTGYGTGTAAYQSQPPAVDAWTKYHVNDILVGGAAVGLALAGSYVWYQKLGNNVKVRALRQLSELKAEDASRMVKGVMRALEKYYELNAKKE